MSDTYDDSIVITDYNSPAIPDDGTALAANEILWSTIKSKVFDPSKDATDDALKLNAQIDLGFIAAEEGNVLFTIVSTTTPTVHSFQAWTKSALVVLVGKGGDGGNSSGGICGGGGGSGEVKIQWVRSGDLAGSDATITRTNGGGGSITNPTYSDDLQNSIAVAWGSDASGVSGGAGGGIDTPSAVGTEDLQFTGSSGQNGFAVPSGSRVKSVAGITPLINFMGVAGSSATGAGSQGASRAFPTTVGAGGSGLVLIIEFGF